MSTTITQAGFEVWFTPGRETLPDQLVSGLRSISLKPPYVPEKRSMLESLQFALTDVAKMVSTDDATYVVRPLKQRDGRHVWLERKGQDKNTLESRFVVKIPEDGKDELRYSGVIAPNSDTQLYIREKFEAYQETLGAKAVKVILFKEVMRLGGVKIDGKDAYFLPPESIDEWRKIEQVVRNATISHDVKWYEQEYKLTGVALDAVKCSVEDEIVSEVDGILSELKEGQLSDRVQENRLATLKELASKMQRYESLFNQGLNSCQHRIKEVLNAMKASTAVAQAEVHSFI